MLAKSFFGVVLLLFLLPDGCTDRQLTQSRLAEGIYAELLHQTYHRELDSALLTATELEIHLNQLQSLWRRPMRREKLVNCRYHLDQARAAYSDVITGLRQRNAEMARIQLDRATYELAAADERAFERLYIGGFYDFFSTWQEVHTIIDDQMLCLMEWTEYAWWANLALREWEAVSCQSPEQELYPWSPERWATFHRRKEALDERLSAFKTTIPRGDQCRSQEIADEVDAAVWAVIACFRLEEREGLAN